MDKDYWNSYYLQFGEEENIAYCSSFAEFCLKKNFLKKNDTIVELGSGNGRDAIFFAHKDINVIAIDQSTVAIEIEKKKLHSKVARFLTLYNLDFVNQDYSEYQDIDVFYSRFTIHSITKSDEDILLPKVYNSLKNGGFLCVEVRTVNDPLYGEGEFCEKDTYFTDHRRRFINSEEFLERVLKIGFKLVYFTEENNLSVYKNDNPVLMRIILKK